jgi:hypothetical protein
MEMTMKKIMILVLFVGFVFQSNQAFAWPRLPKGFKFTKAHSYVDYYGQTKRGRGVGISVTFKLSGNGSGTTASFSNIKALLSDSRIKSKDKLFFRGVLRKLRRGLRLKKRYCQKYAKQIKIQKKKNLRLRKAPRGKFWRMSLHKNYEQCMKMSRKTSKQVKVRAFRRIRRSR